MSSPKALVTNATEFLGPPAVNALLKGGYEVLAHDDRFIDESIRRAYESQHPGAIPLSSQTPKAVVAEAWRRAPELSVVVSNDSYPAIHQPIEGSDGKELKSTLDKVLIFPYQFMSAAIPLLKAQTSARVVMVTSSRTKLPMQGGAIPDAARAGANALLKSLSLELAPHGIPVNAIAPNFVYSETYFPRDQFVDNPVGAKYIQETVPAGRLGKMEEVEELVIFLATMKGEFLTGTIIDFDGGWPMARHRPF